MMNTIVKLIDSVLHHLSSIDDLQIGKAGQFLLQLPHVSLQNPPGSLKMLLGCIHEALHVLRRHCHHVLSVWLPYGSS
jgi:hypothetical protein